MTFWFGMLTAGEWPMSISCSISLSLCHAASLSTSFPLSHSPPLRRTTLLFCSSSTILTALCSFHITSTSECYLFKHSILSGMLFGEHPRLCDPDEAGWTAVSVTMTIGNKFIMHHYHYPNFITLLQNGTAVVRRLPCLLHACLFAECRGAY